MRDKVTGARRWVVKIGSALLTADGRGLDRAAMAVWVKQMVALRENLDRASGKIRGLQSTAAEHEKNVEALRKELGALKP